MAEIAIRPTRSLREYASNLLMRIWRNPVDGIVSVVTIGLLIYVAYDFVKWAFVDSVWTASSAIECRNLGKGACWAVIEARGRLILFGLYPFEEQWRAALAGIVMVVVAILSCLRLFHSTLRLGSIWLLAYMSYVVLMGGGIFGLSPVPQSNWGGLALTFYIFAFMLILGMPLAILLAVGRHSGPRWLQIAIGAVIDIVRAVPLIAILFSFALAIPLLLPAELVGERLTRVVVGYAIFFACYQAEIVRGGLQGVDPGQAEAAKSLGLRRWQVQGLVTLPQAFRISMPPTVNQIVSAFKDTSYVSIVGFFDMTASASAALGTGDWAFAYVEVYFVVALIYLVFGYSLSRYGVYLEKQMDKALQR